MQTINEVIFELIWVWSKGVMRASRLRDKAGATGKNEFRGCKILGSLLVLYRFNLIHYLQHSGQ